MIAHGPSNIIRTRVRSKIHGMSLPGKVDFILNSAGHHAGATIPDFTYDKSRLIELDKARHRLIHGAGTPVTDITGSEEFLFI